MKRSILLCFFLSGCATAPAPESTATPQAAAPVKLPLTRVERQDMSTQVSVTGVVEAMPDHLVNVRPLAGGRIEEFLVVEGQPVHKGQLLARLNSQLAQHRLAAAERVEEGGQLGLEPFEAAISVARADTSRVQAELKLAQANAAREENLFRDQVSAKKDLITARSQVLVWQAQLQSSQALVRKAEADLRNQRGQLAVHREATSLARSEADFAQVVAPISGEISQRSLNVGDFADQATPLLQIGDFSEVQVRLAVPVDLSIQFYRGQQLKLGRVLFVGSVVNKASNTYSVLVHVSNRNGQYHEGQTLSVDLGASKKQAVLTVPASALVADPEDPQAQMVCLVEAGKLRRVPVEVGLRAHQRAEVRGDLKVGQQVVASGGYGYPDGTLVSP